MMGYPSDRLFEEVAHLALHFHWPHDEIMALDHLERRRWVREIARIVGVADLNAGGELADMAYHQVPR
jgi:hypothetical protein